MRKWKIGDRVSWSASPSQAQNRTVYTGIIQSFGVGGRLANVKEENYGSVCSVRADILHEAGKYRISKSGPRGIYWLD